VKLPVTATYKRQYSTCLGHLGQCDIIRNDPILMFAQGGQGKYSAICLVSLSLEVLQENSAHCD
jgi:hypothetical protein